MTIYSVTYDWGKTLFFMREDEAQECAKKNNGILKKHANKA